MIALNGFSNEYWGWGGEDDDMSHRISYHGFRITRYPETIARYSMLRHPKETPNPDRLLSINPFIITSIFFHHLCFTLFFFTSFHTRSFNFLSWEMKRKANRERFRHHQLKNDSLNTWISSFLTIYPCSTSSWLAIYLPSPL